MLLIMGRKYRSASEWTTLVVKYVTDEELTNTDRKYVEKILSDCEEVIKNSESKEELDDKEKMWIQLNKYFVYLKSLKKDNVANM